MQENKEPIRMLIDTLSSKLISLYHDVDHARNIAWTILHFVTGYTKSQLIVNSQMNISINQVNKIEHIINMHVVNHKPLQYIFKEVTFLNLTLELHEGILIPRAETEYWCNELIEQLTKVRLSTQEQASLNFLDICTGTGCIGLSLAQAFPLSTVYMIDIDSDACKLAKINAEKNNIKNTIIIKSDLYQRLPTHIRFDLIVSNPPYISYKRWKNLEPMVKTWEHEHALTAKNSGTYLIKKIIKQASLWLRKNGDFNKAKIPQIVIEMDDNQAKKLSRLLKHYRFGNILVNKDLAGRDRTIEATLLTP